MSVKLEFKKIVAVVLGVILVLFPSLSYAQGRGRDDFRHNYRYHEHPRSGLRVEFITRDYSPVFVRGARYYYYDGLYYEPVGNTYVLVNPPVGAIVRSIPPDFRPIVVNGTTYYVDSGTYYVYTPYGYQVVQPPVRMMAVAPEPIMLAPQENQTKVVEGATLGGVFGALLGGIIGHQGKGHRTMGGALAGGALGAVAGGVVGAQMPNQAAQPARVQYAPTYVETPALAVQAPGAAITPAVSPVSPASSASVAPVVIEPAAPVTASATSGAASESFTINIPNARGSYTSVVVKRSGNGYVGPQGEFYSEFPKVSQLQEMYGK